MDPKRSIASSSSMRSAPTSFLPLRSSHNPPCTARERCLSLDMSLRLRRGLAAGDRQTQLCLGSAAELNHQLLVRRQLKLNDLVRRVTARLTLIVARGD